MQRSTYRLAGRLLRIALVVLLLGSVLAQVVVRVAASQSAMTYPDLRYLEIPYSVAAILFIACGQVALLAGWPLLSLVDRGAVFSRPAVRWVDVIAACSAVATVLCLGVLLHLVFFVGAGGPLFYYLGACVVGGLAVVLLMLVIRGVLEAAIAGSPQLDEKA